MKNKIAILLGGLSVLSNAMAQDDPSVVRVETPQPTETIANVEQPAVMQDQDQPAAPGAKPADLPGAVPADLPGAVPADLPGAGPADLPGNAPVAQPAGEQVPPPAEEKSIEEDDGGFLIKDANINDIFQLLARRAGKQYFHNNRLNVDTYKVTGHLNGDTAALKQMEELAFQYGLRMYVKGNTVYAMLEEQLSQLPAKEWTYQLKYLRPTDIDQIRALIQPLLLSLIHI